jgi:hypothetical protein
MQRLAAYLVLSMACLSPAAAAQEPATATAPRPALAEMRAGAAAPTVSAPNAAVRAAIHAAHAPELEALRATDISLSDREVRIILITAGVVILVALLV